MGILFYLLCIFINFTVIINVEEAVQGSNLVKLIFVLLGPIYTGVIIGQVISVYIHNVQESPSVF